MRKYRIEFIMESRNEEESVNHYLSVATDKGLSEVAKYAENLREIDGQPVIRVHHISDHGAMVVI